VTTNIGLLFLHKSKKKATVVCWTSLLALLGVNGVAIVLCQEAVATSTKGLSTWIVSTPVGCYVSSFKLRLKSKISDSDSFDFLHVSIVSLEGMRHKAEIHHLPPTYIVSYKIVKKILGDCAGLGDVEDN